MADQNTVRLSKVAKELNVGIDTIVEQLAKKGHEVKNSPNSKISENQYTMLKKIYASSMQEKQEAKTIAINSKVGNAVIDASEKKKDVEEEFEDDYLQIKQPTVEQKTKEEPKEEPTVASEETPKETKEDDHFSARPQMKVVGKIDLDNLNKPKKANPKQEETPSKKKDTPEKVKEEPKASTPSDKKVAEKPATNDTSSTPKEDKAASAKAEETTAPKESPKEPVKPSAKEEKSTQSKKAESNKEAEKVKQPAAEGSADSTKEVQTQKQPLEQKEPNKPVTEEKIKEQKAEAKAQSESGNTDQPTEETTSEVSGKVIEAKADALKGLTVLGKIELPDPKKKKAKPVASSDDKNDKRNKRKRKRVNKSDDKAGATSNNRNQGQGQGQQGQGQGQGNKKGGPQGNRDQQGQGGRDDNRGGQNRGGAQGKGGQNAGGNNKKRKKPGNKKEEISEKDIKQGMKSAMSRMGSKQTKSTRSKHKRERRQDRAAAEEARMQQEMQEASILKVTEFISTNELANLMEVSVNEVIAACMNMGMFISINQRLDQEAIELIATEFEFEVQFQSAEDETDVKIEEDKEEDLLPRAPIVTIMGHVDHGKTSLLDYIRNANVASGEAGGITQHIGAYDVTTKSGNRIAFLDTPGHEAFTAMRARGAKLTDVAIIVVAADDSVMPQTKEAINHAQVAEVPIVIAINKVDKPTADVNRIKEQLAAENILVEDWGGKYQCFEISAKTGQGIDDLLEGLLLESEVLELKANPDRKAVGTVVEASLDKGRGYVGTVLIQTGTLRVGDVMLAGAYFGKVKAMLDHRGNRMKEAGPSTPVQILGLNGAPQAGDKLTVMDGEKEARDMANKREQILREQSIRAKSRLTLDMIGKRIAQGSFHQLNVIVKGDVDGSVEALSDSLLKLSTDEVEVRIIHKAVGAISESDILLAAADPENPTLVLGFQVRPTANARHLAEKDGIELRTYSVIYDAINDVKDAMEGLLSPDIEEEIVGEVDVREVFRISKVGTVAGCFVRSGYIKRSSKIRLIRDGIVIYGGEQGGEIAALKRFKDDVNEVKTGYECGLSITSFNDIQEGDVIEVFEHKEVKRTLENK